jgi:hypothetical protein
MQDIVMQTLANCANQRILPWGLNAGIVGESWIAHTNLGNPVPVWVPGDANPLRRSYFCHGWALGTYQLHGYTVFSGPPLQTVLNDEWAPVVLPAAGDICVWFGPGGGLASTPLHSARVELVGGAGVNMLLRSKNGTAPLGGAQAFAAVNAVYGGPPHNCNARRFYRRTIALPNVLPPLPE